MAQIFKSKDLTFAVPEKESAERPNCAGGTFHVSLACTVHCTCTVHTVTICTCTVHTPVYCTCTVHTTITICTFGSHTITITPTTGCTGSETPISPIENEISQITDAETLKTLNDKLVKSLEEVKARQAELSKAKK
jgi:hypothetical protein